MKLFKLITATFIVLLSGISNADNDAQALVKQDAFSMGEDPIFTYLRKSQHLKTVCKLAGKWFCDGHAGNKDNKLAQKGKELANLEKQSFIPDPEKAAALLSALEEMKSSGKDGDLESIYQLLRDNEIIREFLTGRPANREQLQLMFAEFYDTKEFLSGFFQRDISSKQVENVDQLLSELDMSPKEFKELINLIYNDELEQYNKFVEENKWILDNVQKLIENNFKIKTFTRKCRTIKNKEFCTSGNEEREIRSLSEIMPYLMNLQAQPAIEAKNGDL